MNFGVQTTSAAEGIWPTCPVGLPKPMAITPPRFSHEYTRLFGAPLRQWLDELVNLKHSLARLATHIDWSVFVRACHPKRTTVRRGRRTWRVWTRFARNREIGIRNAAHRCRTLPDGSIFGAA